MNEISWKLINTYFKENKNCLVAHHLESYNDFFNKGIFNIFRENNPVRFIQREEEDKQEEDKDKKETKLNQCFLYLGGKQGDKIYFGKPIIYDDNITHYMYPNDARLRNMNYGMTIHYDVDVEVIYFVDNERKEKSWTIEKIYLGKFPIMLQSKFCILDKLAPEVRFNMGECRNDFGGYFIIDGKEKVILPQEKFANNMLYIRKGKKDDLYNYSAEIRSVSEDASKPMRTSSVKMVAPSLQFTNQQLVVDVPNVKKPIPLFILMRALGIQSDKQIIQTCLLDLVKYEYMIDLFVPSVHDANKIFNQSTALKFIASFTKRGNVDGVLDILMNYFLPHIGEQNYLDKAYYVGWMVHKLLKVYTFEEKPTDRDSFLFKRVDVTGTLLYDLFREYYLIQHKEIAQKIDKEHYYHKGSYENEKFLDLIQQNVVAIFKEKTVEKGFKKAFKGNWGASANTKKVGVVQDLNRLSWFSHISHLRKLILPLDASAKVVGPRHLNSSQWGFVDPVDTPDGSHIGLHKHLSISTIITNGSSSVPLIKWLRINVSLKFLQECSPIYLATHTKMIVNGNWVGVIEDPVEVCDLIKLYRRNGLLPMYLSIRFDSMRNEMNLFTDSGRLMRPVYYVVEDKDTKQLSFERKDVMALFKTNKIKWSQLTSGLREKRKEANFLDKDNKIYKMEELYPDLLLIENEQNEQNEQIKKIKKELTANASVIDYVDTNEEESALIAIDEEHIQKNKAYSYTHVEIDPSFLFGVMGNSVIFPEHNQFPRDVFSCGQSRQAVSVYHTNFQMRMDTMGVILNYGETPLIKSRYLKLINNEEQPYGVNAVVAIMSYTGYNVEDAILINQGAIDRGLFRTSYFTLYEGREESSKISGNNVNSVFSNILDSKKQMEKTKQDYDYTFLDKNGMIKENTPLNDKMVLIGKISTSVLLPDIGTDSSITPKKGQLGFVDKVFLTEGEEGTKIAKVRVREQRIPSLGDKMASRAGQKGTLGLILAEEDMPFTSEGIRPDLIINPHALPSRMTIGQLVESMLGKVCSHYGGFGDCTAFLNKGSHADTYGNILTGMGYHSSGNELLYNGMTGEQLQADIYIGPTYYMRLKHMVKDKINFRARGPRTNMTRQTVQGRSNDGGLRIGEMERDGILAHGASTFLNDSFMIRGDEYYIAVCNKSGSIAIYNESQNVFLSPYVDGPVQFITGVDGSLSIDNVSKIGKSFSIIRIPYSLKLLIQELLVMNIQMRVITEDNLEQLSNLSYPSSNLIKLLHRDEDMLLLDKGLTNNNLEEKDKLQKLVIGYNRKIISLIQNTNGKKVKLEVPEVSAYSPPPDSPPYAPVSPAYQSPININPDSPPYAPVSPAYQSPININPDSPPYAPFSPAYQSPININPDSPPYAPVSPAYQSPINQMLPSQNIFANTVNLNTQSGGYYATEIQSTPTPTPAPFPDEELNTFFFSLPLASQDKIMQLADVEQQMNVLRSVKAKKERHDQLTPSTLSTKTNSDNILEFQEETIEEKKEINKDEETPETKKISFTL